MLKRVSKVEMLLYFFTKPYSVVSIVGDPSASPKEKQTNQHVGLSAGINKSEVSR